MKRILFVFVSLFCAAIFFSCDKPEPVEEPSEIKLTLNTSLVKFDKAGGTQTVELTTRAQAWTATLPSGCDWCTVEPAAGSGDATLTITAQDNPETSRRTVTLTLSAEGAKDLQISVSQDAQEKKTGLYSDPEIPDADSPCTLYFLVDKSSPLFGKTELYAHVGVNEWSNVQADWGSNTDKCKWTKTDEPNLWSLSIEPSVREWFGTGDSEVYRISMVIRSADGSSQTGNMYIPVNDSKYSFTAAPLVEEAVPSGALHGINYNADGSVTFVFYEKDKKGNRYDWCYLIGEFSDWECRSEYAMKRDESAGCWWTTCTGFESGKEYLFQYMTGNTHSRMRLSDPYSEIIYCGDDQWISSASYPELRAYPSGTTGYVSAFEIGRPSYSWEVSDFKVEDENDLIIYELLLRDFTENGGKEGNLAGALEKLDYLEELGVNAIELMPVQEFDGNDSWGYNPNHYFAMDKAYGTREMYKKFIDECHKRGLAVIVDVVYNHLTGNNAFDAMYPLEINPFFNVEAPHPYSVFEDINHEDKVIADYIKRSLGYLLTEYKVDGFRFDLTKGFTNNPSTEATASNYDASRVAILKGYNDYIRSVKPDAIVILEHFCDPENNELAAEGMQVWRNLNGTYREAAKGKASDFSGLYTGKDVPFGTYVGYMESHDEERMGYDQTTESGIKDDIELRMKRLGLNAAFFFTVPGPKMIWQFGEMGYDISINQNGRTGRKPVHWEYLNVPERKALYDTYAALIKFRRDNPEFFDSSATFSWTPSGDIKTIDCSANGKKFHVVGNFSKAAKDVILPSGSWKDHLNGSAAVSGTVTLQQGEFLLLTDYQ